MDKTQLLALREKLENAIIEIDVALAAINTDPGIAPEVPVDEPSPAPALADWECYINRYDDLKRAVQGKTRAEKEQFAKMHFERFGSGENRKWGCQTTENPTGLESVETQHGGFLWKPIAESRGGVPVLLTPSSWERADVELQNSDGTKIQTQIEFRGRTNGNRETYFFLGVKAVALPLNTILVVGSKKFVIPDPTLRYE